MWNFQVVYCCFATYTNEWITKCLMSHNMPIIIMQQGLFYVAVSCDPLLSHSFRNGVLCPLKGLILLSKDCVELFGCVPSVNKINNSVWKVQPNSSWARQCAFICKIKHKPSVNFQWAGATNSRKEGFISASYILQKLYRSSGEEVKHKYTLHPDVPQFIQARYNAANVSDVSHFFTTCFTYC